MDVQNLRLAFPHLVEHPPGVDIVAAEGLDRLERRLPEQDFQLVQKLRREEKEYLEPLRAHHSSKALEQGAPEAASQIIRHLIRHAPRHILRRLTPLELRLLLTGYRLARHALRELDRPLRR